jgi:NDP-sugar pyrophosphorylase family protein
MVTGDLSLSGYARVNGAWVDTSARVDPGARFVGDVLVGPGCVIDDGAMIIGPTTVGADCVIGEQAIVSRSAVWDRCRVGAGAHIDQCILTDDACLEPGAAIRNAVRVAPLRLPATVAGRLARLLRGGRPAARVAELGSGAVVAGPPAGETGGRPTGGTEWYYPPGVWARRYRRRMSSPMESKS